MRTITLGFAFLLLAACSSLPERLDVPVTTKGNPVCGNLARKIPARKAEATLDRVSHLFESKCFAETIALGRWIRSHFREKSYSITAETLSIFVPEESASDYTLESYERTYLAILMAAAHLSIGEREAAAVELRRSYSESQAILYNFGEDPVNALLVASLWDNLGEAGSARPFWMKVQESQAELAPLHSFAKEQIARIDSSRPLAQPWNIVLVNRLPILDWKIRLASSESGYYELAPKTEFPNQCRSRSGAVLPTEPWVKKIGRRYAKDYHPLLNLKSWVRLPIGVAYGVTTFGLGLGIVVGGCAADFYAEAEGNLCEVAAEGGGALMGASGDVMDYALQPDLRRWRNVPAAVLVTAANKTSDEICWQEMSLEHRAFSASLLPVVDVAAPTSE